MKVPGDSSLRQARRAAKAEGISEFCPTFAAVMKLLGRRWMAVVLRVLLAGPRRFNEILAAVPGLSDPLLTKRLREMEALRLLERRVLPTSPVGVQYELTEAGRDLERAVRVISEWADRWWRDVGPASRAARPGSRKSRRR